MPPTKEKLHHFCLLDNKPNSTGKSNAQYAASLPNVVPIYQNEISIGRGSTSKPVDISLSGDPEISRRHLSLTTDGQNNFWIINEGRNPAMINNYELQINQKISVSPGVPIAICSLPFLYNVFII